MLQVVKENHQLELYIQLNFPSKVKKRDTWAAQWLSIYLPLAQGVIPGSWDQVPHRGSRGESASPSACVSASLCVSFNK